MKIVCKTLDLVEAINTVQKAITNKSTIPLLDGILIESYEGVKLTGNNLEIGIEYNMGAAILETGSIVVNSKLFGDIVRKLPDSDVCIEVKRDKVIIDCLKSHFEMAAIVPEGYPKLPLLEKEAVLKIKEKDLKEMIRGTIFAVGTDENRKNLTGTLLEKSDESIVMVAIDGFRMAWRKKNYDTALPQISVIIPGNAMNEISKILQQEERDVSVYASKSLIAFEVGDCKIISRLIEAQYLNYKTVIPNYHETKVRVRTKDFLQSIERASLMSMDEKKYPIRFSITEDRLILSSSASLGNVREEVPAEIFGTAMEIGFNPKYFMDALKAIDDEVVDLYLTSSIGPATLKPLEGDPFAYMILPVKIAEEVSATGTASEDEA